MERSESPSTPTKDETWTAMLTKQRMLLNMKLLGQFASQSGAPSMKEDKPTYREQFVPPDMSMVSYFLSKVCRNSNLPVKIKIVSHNFCVKKMESISCLYKIIALQKSIS